jgi:hypothetical protein
MRVNDPDHGGVKDNRRASSEQEGSAAQGDEAWVTLGLSVLPGLVRDFMDAVRGHGEYGEPSRYSRTVGRRFLWVSHPEEEWVCDAWGLCGHWEVGAQYVETSRDWDDVRSHLLGVDLRGSWVLSTEGEFYSVDVCAADGQSRSVYRADRQTHEAFVRNVDLQAHFPKLTEMQDGWYAIPGPRGPGMDSLSSIEQELRSVFKDALKHVVWQESYAHDVVEREAALGDLAAQLSLNEHACPHCQQVSTDFRVLGYPPHPMYCVCRKCGRSFSPDAFEAQ